MRRDEELRRQLGCAVPIPIYSKASAQMFCAQFQA